MMMMTLRKSLSGMFRMGSSMRCYLDCQSRLLTQQQGWPLQMPSHELVVAALLAVMPGVVGYVWGDVLLLCLASTVLASSHRKWVGASAVAELCNQVAVCKVSQKAQSTVIQTCRILRSRIIHLGSRHTWHVCCFCRFPKVGPTGQPAAGHYWPCVPKLDVF
jgi:hypothetical protein